MKTKYIVVTISIISIIIGASILIGSNNEKKVIMTPKAVPINITNNKPINQEIDVNIDKMKEDINSDEVGVDAGVLTSLWKKSKDISNWQRHENKEIGMVIKYPAEIYDINVFHPENDPLTIELNLKGSEYGGVHINYVLNGQKLIGHQFGEEHYDRLNGISSAEKICPKNKTNFDLIGNICRIEKINGNNVVIENSCSNGEGSSHFSVKAMVQSKFNKLKWITLSADVGDINKVAGESCTEWPVKKISQDVWSRKNLSEKDSVILESLDKILQTIDFTN